MVQKHAVTSVLMDAETEIYKTVELIGQIAGWVWGNPAHTVLAIELVAFAVLNVAVGPLWSLRVGDVELWFRQLVGYALGISSGVIVQASSGLSLAWCAAFGFGVYVTYWVAQRPWRW